mmetsp:Transcript_12009/g.29562  ORF Transcript_12009/g.29562 Transcript_12009/m.29562 type:complete len:181 (-) Transcript_12009:197-739(-)
MHSLIAPKTKGGNANPWYHQKHEGSFYPSRMMTRLINKLDKLNGSWESFLRTNAYLEEIVFPTWAMQRRSHLKSSSKRRFRRGGMTTVAFTGGPSRDPTTRFTTPEQINEILRTTNDVFAVKPVNRSLADEEGTKKFIMHEVHRTETRRARKVCGSRASAPQCLLQIPPLIVNGRSLDHS